MIRFRAKAFDDSDAVLRRHDRAAWKYLSRAGGLVRSIARRSIRKSKKKSDPGKPPRSHSGGLKNSIFFERHRGSMSATIGPTDSVGKSGKFVTSKKAPTLLEFGGKTRVRRQGRNGEQNFAATYGSRPFMAPALKSAEPKLSGIYANSFSQV